LREKRRENLQRTEIIRKRGINIKTNPVFMVETIYGEGCSWIAVKHKTAMMLRRHASQERV